MKDKIYVVEGIHDENKLKSIFKDIKTVSVNGAEINEEAISLLKELKETHEIILCMDPDHPGMRIRNIIEIELKDVSHVYFKKQDAISKSGRKVGLEHIDNKIIKEAISHPIFNQAKISDITYGFLYDAGLIGSNRSKEKREIITDYYSLGMSNSKTLIKKLRWLGINQKDVSEVLKNK